MTPISSRCANALRGVRLEVLYKNDEEIQRRLKGVNAGLLQQNRAEHRAQLYYEKPNYQAMAEGALDNIEALRHTTKLTTRPKCSTASRTRPPASISWASWPKAARKSNRRRMWMSALLGLFKAIRDVNKVSISLPEEMLVVEFTEGALNRLDDYDPNLAGGRGRFRQADGRQFRRRRHSAWHRQGHESPERVLTARGFAGPAAASTG